MATIKIEVVYAAIDKQVLLQCEVSLNTTVKDAILQSGILNIFTEIILAQNQIGIFSKKVSLDTIVKEGDRIEIYRPLLIDPKEARRIRAKRK